MSLQSDQNIRRISDNMLIAVILGVFMFTVTQSHPSYKSRILNGNNVPDPCCPGRKWGRVGHTSPRDTALNNFGRVSKIILLILAILSLSLSLYILNLWILKIIYLFHLFIQFNHSHAIGIESSLIDKVIQAQKLDMIFSVKF